MPSKACLKVHASKRVASIVVWTFLFASRRYYSEREARFELLVRGRTSSSSLRHVVKCLYCARVARGLRTTVCWYWHNKQYCSIAVVHCSNTLVYCSKMSRGVNGHSCRVVNGHFNTVLMSSCCSILVVFLRFCCGCSRNVFAGRSLFLFLAGSHSRLEAMCCIDNNNRYGRICVHLELNVSVLPLRKHPILSVL